MIPVKKADTPVIPMHIDGIARYKLLKKVSPPLCPKAMKRKSNPRKATKAIINPIDHLPNWDPGKKLNSIFFLLFVIMKFFLILF